MRNERDHQKKLKVLEPEVEGWAFLVLMRGQNLWKVVLYLKEYQKSQKSRGLVFKSAVRYKILKPVVSYQISKKIQSKKIPSIPSISACIKNKLISLHLKLGRLLVLILSTLPLKAHLFFQAKSCKNRSKFRTYQNLHLYEERMQEKYFQIKIDNSKIMKRKSLGNK